MKLILTFFCIMFVGSSACMEIDTVCTLSIKNKNAILIKSNEEFEEFKVNALNKSYDLLKRSVDEELACFKQDLEKESNEHFARVKKELAMDDSFWQYVENITHCFSQSQKNNYHLPTQRLSKNTMDIQIFSDCCKALESRGINFGRFDFYDNKNTNNLYIQLPFIPCSIDPNGTISVHNQNTQNGAIVIDSTINNNNTNPLFPQTAYYYTAAPNATQQLESNNAFIKSWSTINQQISHEQIARQQVLNNASLKKLILMNQPTASEQKITPTNPHLMPVYTSQQETKKLPQAISIDQKKLLHTSYQKYLTFISQINTSNDPKKNGKKLCLLFDQISTLKQSGITERMLCFFAYTYQPESLQECLNSFPGDTQKNTIIFEQLRKYNKNLKVEKLTPPSTQQIRNYRRDINTREKNDLAYKNLYEQQIQNCQQATFAYNYGIPHKINKNQYSSQEDFSMHKFHLLINHLLQLRCIANHTFSFNQMGLLAKNIYEHHTKKYPELLNL